MGVEPVPGGQRDRDRNPAQQHAVERRGQDLEPVIAEGAPKVGRARSQPAGHEREQQTGGVGEDVSRVGLKGEAAREDAAHALADRDGQREPESHEQRPGLGPAGRVGG